MTSGQRMLRNATALFASQPITFALSLVFTVLVPRNVGPTEWGEWVIAGSIGAVAASLLDGGLNTVLIKEIPRHPAEASRYLGAVLTARLAFAPILVASMVVFGHLAGYRPHTQIILGLVALTVAVAYIGKTLGSGLQAIQMMQVMAFAAVLIDLVMTSAAIVLIKVSALGIISICAVAIFATVAGQAVQLAGLSRHVKLKPSLDWSLLRRVVKAGLPYWANQLFFVAYVWIDGIILSIMASSTEVGWYGVGVQLIATLGFVPSIVTTVVFPELSWSFHADRAKSVRLAAASFRLLVTVSIPMVVGLALVATPLVTTIYGGWFAPAGLPLTVLAMTLLPVYIATLGNAFIIAADRQLQWTWVMAAMFVVNLLLNLITIPFFHSRFGNGAVGAAVALLITDCLTGALAIVLLPKAFRGAVSSSGSALLRSLLATALMAAVVWPLRSAFLPIPVVAGAITFGVGALLFKVFPTEDLRAARAFVEHLAGPARRLLRRDETPEVDAKPAA